MSPYCVNLVTGLTASQSLGTPYAVKGLNQSTTAQLSVLVTEHPSPVASIVTGLTYLPQEVTTQGPQYNRFIGPFSHAGAWAPNPSHPHFSLLPRFPAWLTHWFTEAS